MAIITTPDKGWYPDTTFVAAADAAPEALVLNELAATCVAAPQGDQASVRVPFIDADPAASMTFEGDPLDESDPALTDLVIPTVKIGFISRLSNEAYSHIGGDADKNDTLEQSLRRAITAQADTLFLNNIAPEPPAEDEETASEETESEYTPQPATYSIDGLATNTNLIDGGTIDATTMLTPIIDTLAQLGDNGATPTAIIASNTAWARLLKLKYADGRGMVNPDVQAQTLPMLLGLPVIRNSAAPKDTLFIVDSTRLFTAFGDIAITVDHSYYFGSDSTAVRVTARIGWGFAHKNMAARLTVSDPTATAAASK